LQKVPGIEKVALANPQNMIIRVPVTQSVIYGWYDNEMGSYVNMLGDRTVSIAESM
jgi:glyceraldehyde 3-phosphate dehydrogenase